LTSKVAIVRGERGHKPVFEALELVNYKSALAGYTSIIIKVNFIAVQTWDTGATTDPMVVEAIIRKLKDLPVKVFIVESDATVTNADKAFEFTGMRQMAENNGVECVNLRNVKDKVKIIIPNGETLNSITVPRLVRDSAIINVAKLKTHNLTGVTLGLKNMFGLLPDKMKGKYHLRGINKVIVDINVVLKPVLTVIDGFVGMEGKGPSNGTPVKMDLIIDGTDVVATDATASRIMGFDPHKINHILKAYEKGLGNIDDIQILGEKLENVIRPFQRS